MLTVIALSAFALELENGGYTTEDEAPMFGDDLTIAILDDGVEVSFGDETETSLGDFVVVKQWDARLGDFVIVKQWDTSSLALTETDFHWTDVFIAKERDGLLGDFVVVKQWDLSLGDFVVVKQWDTDLGDFVIVKEWDVQRDFIVEVVR